ncbi:hypothetical protein GMOD_00005140 [Pyrenophora seminiperda CCB06]|uniref:Fungal N-terminal domain-containing protein n=1 Tax=Pyrenophora seminiperda CCB06 TaxID=1302712 RepID=A0A3M7LUZ3_9PLEO|nr:hypothetical protein GMOD_00005140 [Pyrenophora seminiperda CCB06]
MAETIGLIASVLQLAGTGLKLSQALYEYADAVASADRRIRDIAKEVRLTSFVIEELGSVFRQDETASVISENAVQTANETIEECSVFFAEIEVTLNKSKKGKLGRLLLPFRDSKIELLRSHIDKLKSTLQLLMQVLTHAYQVWSKKIDRKTEEKERAELKRLLENKKNSTKRWEESLRNFSISDSSTAVDDEERSIDEKDGSAFGMATIGSTMTCDTLADCVDSIQTLLKDIQMLEQAMASNSRGDDHSENHQRAVGSYFRARSQLDSILLGGNADSLGNNDIKNVGVKLGSSLYGVPSQELQHGSYRSERNSRPKFKGSSRTTSTGIPKSHDKQNSIPLSLSAPPRRPSLLDKLSSSQDKPTSPSYGVAPISPSGPRSPIFAPTLPGYAPTSPGYAPASPAFSPASPGYEPTSPRYEPTSPNFSPASPGYSPTSPTFPTPDTNMPDRNTPSPNVETTSPPPPPPPPPGSHGPNTAEQPVPRFVFKVPSGLYKGRCSPPHKAETPNITPTSEHPHDEKEDDKQTMVPLYEVAVPFIKKSEFRDVPESTTMEYILSDADLDLDLEVSVEEDVITVDEDTTTEKQVNKSVDNTAGDEDEIDDLLREWTKVPL